MEYDEPHNWRIVKHDDVEQALAFDWLFGGEEDEGDHLGTFCYALMPHPEDDGLDWACFATDERGVPLGDPVDPISLANLLEGGGGAVEPVVPDEFKDWVRHVTLAAVRRGAELSWELMDELEMLGVVTIHRAYKPTGRWPTKATAGARQ